MQAKSDGSTDFLYLRWHRYRANGKYTATNIGEILRDGEHDRLCGIVRGYGKSEMRTPLGDLSDYEYFRLYTECFERFRTTETAKTDLAFFRTLLKEPDFRICDECDKTEALWNRCNRAIGRAAEKTDGNSETNAADVYCYIADYSAWDESRTADAWGQVAGGNALMLLPYPMPQVFHRPDPYHAELAYRKVCAGTAVSEETDLLYAQVLRTAARFCVASDLVLVLGSVSADFLSFYRYLCEQAAGVRILACVDQTTFRFLTEGNFPNCRPAVADADTAVLLAERYPLGELVYFPFVGGLSGTVSGQFEPLYAAETQKRFRERLEMRLPRLTEDTETHSTKTCLRTVCFDNLLKFLHG